MTNERDSKSVVYPDADLSAGLSTDGVLICGSAGSIKRVSAWLHSHTAVVPSLRAMLEDALAQQAPAVAAEPDWAALSYATNEWADMASNGLQWLRNVVDGISSPEEALASRLVNLKHCEDVGHAPEVQRAIMAASYPKVAAPQPTEPAQAFPADFPHYELRFIMRVLSHEGGAPREDWQTARGMASAIYERWRAAQPTEPAQPATQAGAGERGAAFREAGSLATRLFKKHFAHEPDYASGKVVWRLCDTTRGIISQIDNMVSGLVRPTTEQPGDAVSVQWWLAELDRYGNPKLTDGAHGDRAGADRAKYLIDAMGLVTRDTRHAVARVELFELRPSDSGVNHQAIGLVNAARAAHGKGGQG
jgi:hypothetical protein